MMKKKQVVKKTTFFSELWALWCDRVATHKALRYLSKQEWSVEFLTAMLIRAARISGQQLQMKITGPSGISFTVTSLDTPPASLPDDDIFNHLDDEMRIRQFINKVSK